MATVWQTAAAKTATAVFLLLFFFKKGLKNSNISDFKKQSHKKLYLKVVKVRNIANVSE
jgi:hypothetical protein